MSFMKGLVSATILACALVSASPATTLTATQSDTEKTNPLAPREVRARDAAAPAAEDSAAARARQARRDSIERVEAREDSVRSWRREVLAGKVFPDSMINGVTTEFITETDRFNGRTITRLSEDITLMPGVAWAPDVRMDLIRPKAMGGSGDVWMEIRYIHQDWAFLSGHIEFLVDERLRIQVPATTPQTPERQVIDGGVYERFVVLVPRRTLVRLAQAKCIEIRLPGDRSNVEKWFPIEGIAALRKYTATYKPATTKRAVGK